MNAKVAKEKTFRGTGREFVLMGGEGLSIKEAAEDTKVIIRRILIEKEFESCFVVMVAARHAVDKISSCKDTFALKFEKNIGLEA